LPSPRRCCGAIYNAVGFGYDGRKQDHLGVYGTTKIAVRYFTESVAKQPVDAGESSADCSPRS
jgi:hypothetical protein